MAVDLSTLLGSLLAEISRARMGADLETARLAELYAGDSLLRHMPVPRFRLPDVEITLPVVVDDVEGEGETPAQPELPSEARRKDIVTSALSFAGVALKPAERKSVLQAIDDEVKRLDASPAVLRGSTVARSVGGAAERALRAVLDRRRTPPAGSAIRRFADTVQRSVQEDVARQIKAMHRLRVLPRTQDVQAQQDSGRVMELRLTISEEAYELRLGEDEGGDPVDHFGPE